MQPVTIGPLNKEDQTFLSTAIEKTVKYYTVIIVVCLCFFWLVIPLFVAFGLMLARRNSVKQLDHIKNSPLTVQKISGPMTKKVSGFEYGQTLFITVGGYQLPMLVTRKDLRSLTTSENGTVVTAEIIPEIKMNKAIYDVSGKGYDFIRRKPLP